MNAELRKTLKILWTAASVICVTIVALPLSYCAIDSMVRTKPTEPASAKERVDPCEDDEFELCRIEGYFQDRVIESLDTSGTAVVADVYGRAWDSACLVLPYEDADKIASQCTPAFQCTDRLAAAVDQQYWHNNDSLWGLLLFSDCKFVLAARFQLRRLDFDFKSNAYFAINESQATQIQLVKRDSTVSGREPSYQVRVVLGSDH